MAGKTDIVIPAFTDKELTVKGDTDLIASNIRKGKNLFGVAGTMEEGVDADTGVISSVSGKEITIPTTKKRTKLMLVGLADSGQIFSTSETTVAYGEVTNYSPQIRTGTVTFNATNIVVKVNYYTNFSNVEYFAYN